MSRLILKNYTKDTFQLLTILRNWLRFLSAASPKNPCRFLNFFNTMSATKLILNAVARKQVTFTQPTYISRLGQTSYQNGEVYSVATLTSLDITNSLTPSSRHPKTKPMPLAQLFSCCLNVFTSLRSVLACLCVSIRTVMSSCNQCTQVKWVTVEKCAELVGLTKDAIDALRTKGKLRQNLHWKKWEGRVYINLQAYQNSIEQEFKA